MKNIFKYIITVVALLVGFTAFGQTQSGLNVDKKVTDNGDGTYTLELETFVTGKSTTNTSVKPINAILVLDISGSMDEKINGKTKLASLKESALSFVDTLRTNALKNDVAHKVSVISFGTGTNVPVKLSDGDLSNETKYNTVRSQINSLSAFGWTGTGDAMNNALTQAKTVTNSDATNLVILFTDGVPSITGDIFNYYIASNAITYSRSIKDLSTGFKVYTIGIFDDETSSMTNYMEAVSSNYPKAQASASWVLPFIGYNSFKLNDRATDPHYYHKVDDGEALQNVFETIASEAIASSDEKRAVNTKAEIYDEITADFLIPRSDSGSIDKNNIVITYADVKSIDGWRSDDRSDWVFKWDTERAPKSSDGDIKVSIGTREDGKDYVSVTGFDFQSNWCGPVVVNGNLTSNGSQYHGSKMIIRITIVQNPNSDGGALTTNTGNSGVYVNNVQLNPSFPVPSTAATEYKVTVKNNSLQNGDSAVYTITRSLNGVVDSSYKLQLILTSDTSVAGISNEKSVKLRLFKGSDENAKYKYTVTETLWNWTYSKSKASLEAVVADQISGLSGPYVFDFSGGTKNDVKIKNVEKTY